MSITGPRGERETAPVARADVHWVGFVISSIGIIVWTLGRFVFRGQVPDEVVAFVQYAVPLALGWLAGEARWRTARRRAQEEGKGGEE